VFEACVWVTGSTEWKPLIGDAAWSRGPNYPLEGGAPSDIAPRFFHEAGRVERVWPRFESGRLGRARGIWVYVPPTYDENVAARFPVVYMHDGQNLFDDGSAFGGASWRVADTMNEGAARGTIAEAIVVGVENTGDRMEEYTPPSPSHPAGRADRYGEFLALELKPAVDAAFRSRPEREWTSLAGSSLGGLVSVYVGLSRPEVFGRIAAFSPSTWWDGRWIVGFVRDSERRSPPLLRVYLDSGTPGDDDRNTRVLADTFLSIGYTQDARFRYVTERGGTHDERSWARRFPAAAAFLLGSRDGSYAQEMR
jgi:predicted alpha/beta superfamily hydrolase